MFIKCFCKIEKLGLVFGDDLFTHPPTELISTGKKKMETANSLYLNKNQYLLLTDIKFT